MAFQPQQGDGARLVMLLAIGLNFISQFLLYYNDAGHSLPGTVGKWSFGQIATGWQMHAWVAIIHIGLAFAFVRDGIVNSPSFDRFGWWMAAICLIAATYDGQPFFPGATGAKLGWFTVLLAIVATLFRHRQARVA